MSTAGSLACLLFLLLFRPTHPLSDADILLAFKSTISDPNNILRSWRNGTSPATPAAVSPWTGVTCDAGRNVAKLVLENMDLGGVLDLGPLSHLSSLKSLSFMNNRFVGPMPNVGQFLWLRTLYLSGNRLSGEIPDNEFSRMLAVSRIHLARNRFTGRIPRSLAGVERLAEIMVDRNQFQGPIPDFRHVGLKVNVSHNRLEGPIPPALAQLDPSAFMDNKNLCGPPLQTQCNSTGSPPAEKPQFSYFLAFMVLAAVIVVLIIVAFICLLCCRADDDDDDEEEEENDDEYLGHPPSKRIRATSFKITHMERPLPPHGGGSEGAGKKVVKENDHGRLVFVRRDGMETFGLHDLLRASAEVLGSGSFGSSYKAVLTNGSAAVVKRFKEMNAVGREDFSEHMRRLGRLSHPNLLPLVAYYYRKEEKLLVFDYIPNGSLAHILHGNRLPSDPVFDWRKRLAIVKGVARGMAYLHEELEILNLPHGHLKSSNVLLDKQFEPLLTDYALIPVTNPSSAMKIMVANKAPEIVRYGNTTKRADVWSLGVLILEILTGKFPAGYLCEGSSGLDMTDWVNSVVEDMPNGESVFDKQMGTPTRYEQFEMMKLLKIGRSCCEVDLGKRWDLTQVLEKIEEVKEGDIEEFSTCVSDAKGATSEL